MKESVMSYIHWGSPAFVQHGIDTGNPKTLRQNHDHQADARHFSRDLRKSLQVVESDFARNMADLQSQDAMKKLGFSLQVGFT